MYIFIYLFISIAIHVRHNTNQRSVRNKYFSGKRCAFPTYSTPASGTVSSAFLLGKTLLPRPDNSFFFFFLSICNDTPWRPFLKGCSPFSRFSQQKKKKTLLQHKVVCVFIKRKNLSTVCHKSPIVSCVFIPLSFSLFRSLAATAKRNLREIERCCTTKMRELFLRTTATQKRDMRLRQSTEIKKKKEDMCRARPA